MTPTTSEDMQNGTYLAFQKIILAMVASVEDTFNQRIRLRMQETGHNFEHII